MKEKGLIKSKDGFFSKVSIFFKKIFFKNNFNNNMEDISSQSYEENVEDNISTSLKGLVEDGLTKQIQEEIEEEKIDSFMNKIGNDREELRKLDMNTLRNINKHYDKKISKLKTRLNMN